MHSNKLPRQGLLLEKDAIYACSQGDEIVVSRACDDAGMIRAFLMEAYEMATIQGYQRSV